MSRMFSGDGSTRYMTGTSGMRCRVVFMLLAENQSEDRKHCYIVSIQMYCDAPRSKVIDSQYAADHVPPQRVEDQDFPYWLAVRIEDWCCLWDQSVRQCPITVVICVFRRLVVEVEDFLDRCCCSG